MLKYSFRKIAGVVLCCAAVATPGTPIGPPSFDNEQLRYNVNWPSGLSLGEVQLGSSRDKGAADVAPRLHLDFALDAAIPGFAVTDRYHSEASAEFCSVEFDRKASHGQKKTDETTKFDGSGTATRETTGGGKSEMKSGSCGKDALAFLYYLRRELSQGRMPSPQTVYFGAPYEIKLAFAGTQTIKLGDKQVEADRVSASVKGAASEVGFDVFFLKDAARTPALVRVPLTLGTFSMELVR
ncbi:MAG TPA: DUF3108 domain-containing protein [Bryobacteraceae bacterium]|nr:DUF3108 domain-containing protein [Bryobacteraceae bacterium]